MTDTAEPAGGPAATKFEDFDDELEKFALEIVKNARSLKGKQHFSERLDAFKAATAYKAMMNKTAEDDPGGEGILAMQRDLLEEPPIREPAPESDDGPETDEPEE